MNSDTLCNALRGVNPPNAPVVLTDPGGSNPWTFSYNPTLASGQNPGQPVVLEVPTSMAPLTSALGSTIGAANANVAAGTGDPNAEGHEEWGADGNCFLIRATGTVACLQTSRTLKLWLYLGNGLTIPAPGIVGQASMAAISGTVSALNATTQNWFVECRCLWDSKSNQLNFYFQGQIAGVLVSQTAGALNLNTLPNVPAPSTWNVLPFTMAANLNDSPQGANTFNVTMLEFSADRV